MKEMVVGSVYLFVCEVIVLEMCYFEVYVKFVDFFEGFLVFSEK